MDGEMFCDNCKEILNETDNESQDGIDNAVVVKKNRKRLPYVIIGGFLFIIILCITSVLKFNRTPSDKTIENDLKESLMSKYDGKISSFTYSVTESYTEKKYYYAKVEIDAKGECADFEIEGTIYYTKYDQGWQTTGCSLTKTNYTVFAYPKAEILFNYIMQTEEDDAEKYTIIDTTKSGDEITLNYREIVDNGYYTYQRDYYESFFYNAETEVWSRDGEYKHIEASNPQIEDISGTYIVNQSGSYYSTMTISDVRDQSFVLNCSEFDEPMTFIFTGTKYGHASYVYDEDNSNIFYVFYSGDGENADYTISRNKGEYDGDSIGTNGYYKLIRDEE